MKKRGRLSSLLLLVVFALCFHVWVVQPMKENNTVAALAAEANAEQDNTGYYLTVGGEKYDATSEGYELKKDSVTVSIARDSAFPDGMTVDYFISDADRKYINIEHKVNDAGTNFIEVYRLAPGDPSINVTVKIPQSDGTNEVLIFSCKILIGIEITEENHNMLYDKDSSEFVMVFADTKEGPKQVKVQLYGESTGKEFDYKTLDLNTDNHNVAIVDENGMVQPVGAGITKLTAKIKADNGLSYDKAAAETYIVVQPKASFTEDNQYAGYEQNPQMQKIESDSYELYINTADVNNLNWKVYKYTYSTSNRPTMELVDEDDYDIIANKLIFYDVKAGTYRILGYLKDKTGVFEFYNESNKDVIKNPSNTDKTETCYYVETEVLVPLRFNKNSVEMNVGDMFDIMTNTNIPDVDLFSYDAENPYVLRQDQKVKSLFTALSTGLTSLSVVPKTEKAASLFPAPKDTPYNYVLDTESIPVSVINEFTLVLDPENAILYTGGSIPVRPSIEESDIIWETSNEKIATVDENGLVTAKNEEGAVVITARQEINGVIKIATCELYVKKAITKIELEANKNVINEGELLEIHAESNPKLETPIELHWRSSDESILKIDKEYLGVESVRIVGGKPGKAVITAINKDNVVVGFYEVTVKKPVTGLKIVPPVDTIEVGDTIQFTATVSPADATDKDVKWDIVGDIGTISADGKITIKSAGTATVFCRSRDNLAVEDKYTFTVKKPVAGIKLDQGSLELYVGENERLTYTINPKDASNLEVKWTSFDTGIAAVDKTGIVTAIGVGKTEIMVESIDGRWYDFCTVEVKQLPTAVKFATSELTINVGEYFFMNVVLTPADSLDTGLVWEVLDKQIASVTDKGKITGLKPGNTIVSVKAQNADGSFTETAYCKITVVSAVEGLKLSQENVKLEFGATMELKPVFTPAAPTNPKIKWTSSDNTVVSIDENGKITALAGGKAVITAVADDGGYTAMCVVTVPDPVLTINPSVIEIEYGEVYELQAVFQPQSASVLKLTWETSDASKVTVDENGVITGQAGGLAVITAKTADGKCDAMCIVTVTEPVTTIKLTPETLQFGVGEKSQIIAEISNPNASSKELKWSCSDTSVISLDQKGNVTGKKVGKSIVTVAATDGSGAVATCEVEVVQAVESLSLNYVTKTIVQGESFALRATVTPSGATYQNPIWECSDPDIVLIDEKGVVTGLKPGNVWITATANDYVGKSAKCYLTVIPYIGASSVTAMENNIVLTPGEKKTVVVRMMPANTTDSMTWISQDESVAKVNSSTGEITAVSSGKTTVTVMTDSGKKATITVTVVGLSRTSLTMKYYSGSIQLYVEGTTEKVRWYSSDESVVVVSANGTVSTRGIGTAEIEAVVNGRTLICKVTVVGY